MFGLLNEPLLVLMMLMSLMLLMLMMLLMILVLMMMLLILMLMILMLMLMLMILMMMRLGGAFVASHNHLHVRDDGFIWHTSIYALRGLSVSCFADVLGRHLLDAASSHWMRSLTSRCIPSVV
jgi:hypothetical protein